MLAFVNTVMMIPEKPHYRRYQVGAGYIPLPSSLMVDWYMTAVG
jgi:hypothetical protein